VESPSAVRLHSYLFLSPRDPSFARPGVLARITPQFRSRRWIAIRCVIWSTRHALPKEVIEGVTERSGGVPLFVEEVTRLLLERGEQGGIQAIPPTLQQSLDCSALFEVFTPVKP
jgi:hypothetical protein